MRERQIKQGKEDRKAKKEKIEGRYRRRDRG
jgi:hypothetical protein